MKTLTLVSALLLLSAQAAPDSDPRVAWLAKHATRIRTIDMADDDLSDLEPLRATLKGKRVVLLGEGSHGDGTTFVAKSRLIRFLHERMGFNVLAFESGLYDCPKAWDFLMKGEDARTALPRGVFAIWSNTREVQPLFDYVGKQAKGPHPLEVTGVDSQLTSTASEQFLLGDLAAYLKRIDPKLAEGEEWDRVAKLVALLNKSAWETREAPVPPASEQEAFARTIEHWRSMIAQRDHTPATRSWSGPHWRQVLASLRAYIEQEWKTDYSDHAKFADNTPVPVFNMRDVQMGKNLIWLATKRYPKEKIIVWAATGHNARALSTIKTDVPRYTRLYSGWTPMGEVAWKTLGDQLYSIAFIWHDGQPGRMRQTPPGGVAPSSHDSLEDLFTRASFETAFLDFRHPPAGGQWLHGVLTARPLGANEMQADWTRVVDGVVFLKTMDRSHKKE